MRSDTLSRTGSWRWQGCCWSPRSTAAVPAMAQTGGAGPPGQTTTTTTATAPSGTRRSSSPTARRSPRRTRRGRFARPSRRPTGSTPARTSGAAATASFKSRGYDCSGAVSYVLHAAGMLPQPDGLRAADVLGLPGHRPWITVYANRTHAWMTVAGLRFDTSVGRRVPQPGLGSPLAGQHACRHRLRSPLLPRPLAARGRLARPPLLPQARRAALSRAARRARDRLPASTQGEERPIAGVESERSCE